MFDYDDYVCPCCSHIGVEPDGSFDYVCPECEYHGSFEE